MTLRVKDQKEFLAGALFAVIGIVWAFRAKDLPLGTATAMGPGYFPLLVAMLLVCTGALSMVRAIRIPQGHRLEAWNLAPMVSILIGIIAFALLIDRAGLIAATLALILLSNPRRLLQKPLEVAVLASVAAAFVSFLFVYLLGLPLPLY